MLWITKLFVEKYPQVMNIDLEKVMIENSLWIKMGKKFKWISLEIKV